VKPPRSTVNRRDLLRLRPFGGRAGELPRSRGQGHDASWGSGCDLLKATRPGMGSYFEVRLAATTPGGLALATAALDLIGALETQLTVYRDDSEVSRLNATAHLGPVEVEPGLFSLLQTAVALAGATAGAYDVTAGALSVAWGFFKGPRRVPDPETLAEARGRTGSHHLRLDPTRGTVGFDRPGLVINLGSIGKGYALDRVAELIRSHWWPTSALVHGGRSSLYALGSPPGRLGGRWEIALRNPLDPERPLGVVRLRNRGLGTSGAAFQRFEAGGRVYGHIIDPRTGEPPADGPASVTVLAPTAAEADALSTALYLLGPDAAAPLLASRPDVGAIFVTDEASGSGPIVRTRNLTADDFLPAPPARGLPVFG
jgi:thiamine biosynthesis lipoprotein